MPLPSGPLRNCKALCTPGAYAIPPGLTRLWRSIRQEHPRVFVAPSQRANNVQGTWVRVKAMPVPRHLVPGRGTVLRNGRQHGARASRTLPAVLIRKN